MPFPNTVECSEEGCTDYYGNHREGAMEAGRSGWFRQKDGNSWCPLHIPAWVEEWRAKKKEK